MGSRILRRSTLWSVLPLAQASSPAVSQSFVHPTNCEPATINGDGYGRETFSVVNQHPNSVIYSFVMTPIGHASPDDTCHVLQQGFPVDWCGGLADDGRVLFYSQGEPISEGGTLGGFQVVLSRTTCCYRFGFSSSFDTPFALETACLECDLATPAKTSTWGRMKQQYR